MSSSRPIGGGRGGGGEEVYFVHFFTTRCKHRPKISIFFMTSQKKRQKWPPLKDRQATKRFQPSDGRRYLSCWDGAKPAKRLSAASLTHSLPICFTARRKRHARINPLTADLTVATQPLDRRKYSADWLHFTSVPPFSSWCYLVEWMENFRQLIDRVETCFILRNEAIGTCFHRLVSGMLFGGMSGNFPPFSRSSWNDSFCEMTIFNNFPPFSRWNAIRRN